MGRWFLDRQARLTLDLLRPFAGARVPGESLRFAAPGLVLIRLAMIHVSDEDAENQVEHAEPEPQYQRVTGRRRAERHARRRAEPRAGRSCR